jgi:DNA-binding SARP family transcriptional activator
VIDVQVLGPLVVRVGGNAVKLGPVLRVLFLGLLCEQGNLVPADQLAAWLSETGTPQGQSSTLRSHVSHLRRRLADARGPHDVIPSPVLLTSNLGGTTAYALQVDRGRIDATRFEEEVAAGLRELHSGRLREAQQLLQAAMRRWQGQPLADAGGRLFAKAHVKRLEGVRRAALIAHAEAGIQLGLHAAVIDSLEEMASLWPDDLSVRKLHIISLYRSGRIAEASRACKSALVAADEHGLGRRELEAIQLDVLNGRLPVAGRPLLQPAP